MKTVLFLIQDRELPSSRVRVLNLVPELRALGILPTVALYPRTIADKVDVFRRCRDFDAVVIQKKLPAQADCELLKRICRRLVYDFDDAVYLRHESEGDTNSRTRETRFERIARSADLVIAGNDRLAARARDFNHTVVVIPSAVATEGVPRHRHASRVSPAVLGWVGGPINLSHLALLIPALQELAKGLAFELRVLCSAGLNAEGFPHRHVPWALDTQEREIAEFDVGLMPLPPSEHAAGKCGYKALQYMAAGVPPVVSDVGVNRRIVEDGVSGLVVDAPEDFVPALQFLLRHPHERARMGDAARRRVEARFSIRIVARRLAEVLTAVDGL